MGQEVFKSPIDVKHNLGIRYALLIQVHVPNAMFQM